jgi:hypothetical protein
LAILEKEFGQNNPRRTLPALENYATLLRKLGRTNEAVVIEAKAKEIRDKFNNSFTPNLQASPNQSVDPSQVQPATVNTPNVNPANVSTAPPPIPAGGRDGAPSQPPSPPKSKPAKPKPKKRSND